MEINMIEMIANDVISVAKGRPAQDLVAAIYSVWMEVGLLLAQEIDRIREEERNASIV